MESDCSALPKRSANSSYCARTIPRANLLKLQLEDVPYYATEHLQKLCFSPAPQIHPPVQLEKNVPPRLPLPLSQLSISNVSPRFLPYSLPPSQLPLPPPNPSLKTKPRNSNLTKNTKKKRNALSRSSAPYQGLPRATKGYQVAPKGTTSNGVSSPHYSSKSKPRKRPKNLTKYSTERCN